MSTCKTGCGAECFSVYLCDMCDALWCASAEQLRAYGIYGEVSSPCGYSTRVGVALVDFCTRVRAERQNGVNP